MQLKMENSFCHCSSLASHKSKISSYSLTPQQFRRICAVTAQGDNSNEGPKTDIDLWKEFVRREDPREQKESLRKSTRDVMRLQPESPPADGSFGGKKPYIPPKRRNSSSEKARKQYTYGKYGPYRGRAKIVREENPPEPPFSQPRPVFFSTIKNDREEEEYEMGKMSEEYISELGKFNDIEIGIKHFFIFVKRKGKGASLEMPWEDWTLIGQLAVESREEPNNLELLDHLSGEIRSKMGQCVAWFRPDLVFVRYPAFDVRFEPQVPYFKGLASFVDPSQDKFGQNPFLNKIKGELGLLPTVETDFVLKRYNEESDGIQSRVLSLLFKGHKFSPLKPEGVPSNKNDAKTPSKVEKFNPGLSESSQVKEFKSEEDFESFESRNIAKNENVKPFFLKNESLLDEIPTLEGNDEDWEDLVDIFPENEDLIEDSWLQEGEGDSLSDDSQEIWAPEEEGRKKVVPDEIMIFKAAISPFTYKDLLGEVFYMRKQLLAGGFTRNENFEKEKTNQE